MLKISNPENGYLDAPRQLTTERTIKRVTSKMLDANYNVEFPKTLGDGEEMKDNILSDERIPILRLRSHTPSVISKVEPQPQSPKKSTFGSKSTMLFRQVNENRMAKYFRQARPNASIYEPNQASNGATPLVYELNILLSNMDYKDRLKKAARHLNDALYLRAVRHDIDTSKSKLLKNVYLFQTNLNWQTFLYLLSWLFLGMTYVEPPHSGIDKFFDENPSNLGVMLCIEIPVMVLFYIEMIMELYHRAYDKRSFKDKYLTNYKIIFKVLLNLLFLLDLIAFYSKLPNTLFRFSRPLRPFCLIIYSKQLRRTFFGIIKSLRQTFEVLLFFVLVTSIFAAVSIRLIGDLDGSEEYDQFSTNFKDFGTAMNALYILFSKDNYPDVMIPAIKSSPLYLFFFIPFVAINTLLFVPIPIAVIFDAFRAYRADLVVSERIKEREALVACFLSLDIDGSGWLSKDEFMALCTETYGNNLDEEKVDDMFTILDEKKEGKITLDTFFYVGELMEDTKSLSKSLFIRVKPWECFRNIVNRVFRFDRIATHPWYEGLMSLVVLSNTVILLYYAFEDDEDILAVLDMIDDIFVYVYLSEIIIKVFGIGVYNYFTDKWNLLDFSLTIVSLITDVAVSFAKIARTAKAGRLLRLSKAQRAFKIVKALRGFKLFKCCYSGLKSFSRIKRFIENIMLCLPIVLKLTAVLFMISYFYAIVGMEIFRKEVQIRSGESPYMTDPYSDFDSFGGALLLLFQVVVQAKWGDLLFDWAWRLDDLTTSSMYFNTFYSITNLVIISLLTGLIWEVFTYMEKQFEQQDKIDEQLQEIYFSTEDKKKTLLVPKTKRDETIKPRDHTFSDPDLSAIVEEHKGFRRRAKSMNALEVAAFTPKTELFSAESPNKKGKNLLASPLHHAETIGAPRNSTKNKTSFLFPKFGVGIALQQKLASQTAVSPATKSIDDKGDEDDIDKVLAQFEPEGNEEAKRPNNKKKTEIDIPKRRDIRDLSQKSVVKSSIFPDRPFPPSLVIDAKHQRKQDRHATKKPKDQPNSVKNVKTLGELKIWKKEEDLVKLTDEPPTTSVGDNPTSRKPLKKKPTLRAPMLNEGDPFPAAGETEKSLDNSVVMEGKRSESQPVREKKGRTETTNKGPWSKRLVEIGFCQKKDDDIDLNNLSEAENAMIKIHTKRKTTMKVEDGKNVRRKVGRSDSMNFSLLKTVKMELPPNIDQTFITENKNSESDESEDFKDLEREFYERKIAICTHISTEKNQLEYLNYRSNNKEKFKFDYKLLRLDSSDSSDSEEEKDSLSEVDITMSEARTKYLESLKKKMQSQISQPGDRILRKALLQNQNLNMIQKFEDDHFIEMYGKWFEYLKNPKIERIKNVFETENRILIRFMRLMKQHDIVSRDFVEITNMIEESINRNLVREGSLGKFIFKDSQGKWFFVFKDEQKFRIQYLTAGFWNYFEQVFPDKTKLYEGQDILFPGVNEKYADPVEQFYKSLVKIARTISKSAFTDFDKKEGLWNMYMVPFQISSKRQLQLDLLKTSKTDKKIDITCIQDTMITEGVFFSMNYIMKSTKVSNKLADRRIDTMQIVEMEKVKKQTMRAGLKNLKRIVRPVKFMKKRTSLSVHVSASSSDINDLQNQHKKAALHEFLKNEHSDFHPGAFAKTPTKVEEFLPLQEYIDFLRDIRDTINLHKDHLLYKLSMFYSELYSKNKSHP